MKPKVLFTIVLSQFFCTSLWFAGNAVMPDLVLAFHFKPEQIGQLTSAVQLGFILGTLTFAVFSIADRFSPTLLFFLSAALAAIINLAIGFTSLGPTYVLLCRFATGFFLAGIYPVGMKIASDHAKGDLGKSLGFLVGALVLGTAFPHLLKSFTWGFSWVNVIYATSGLSFLGGLAMFLFVPDLSARNPGQKLNIQGFLAGFTSKKFRAAAIGYFGHMWELYAYWVFVPVILSAHQSSYPDHHFSVPLFSFLIIASGTPACILSGMFSKFIGTKKLAILALGLSCLCCLVSPLFLRSGSFPLLIIFLFVWGMAVIADSPLFSTLVAINAPVSYKGTALTIVNCIGFSITIISIQMISLLRSPGNTNYIFILLAAGPVLGLTALLRPVNN